MEIWRNHWWADIVGFVFHGSGLNSVNPGKFLLAYGTSRFGDWLICRLKYDLKHYQYHAWPTKTGECGTFNAIFDKDIDKLTCDFVTQHLLIGNFPNARQ